MAHRLGRRAPLTSDLSTARTDGMHAQHEPGRILRHAGGQSVLVPETSVRPVFPVLATRLFQPPHGRRHAVAGRAPADPESPCDRSPRAPPCSKLERSPLLRREAPKIHPPPHSVRDFARRASAVAAASTTAGWVLSRRDRLVSRRTFVITPRSHARSGQSGSARRNADCPSSKIRTRDSDAESSASVKRRARRPRTAASVSSLARIQAFSSRPSSTRRISSPTVASSARIALPRFQSTCRRVDCTSGVAGRNSEGADSVRVLRSQMRKRPLTMSGREGRGREKS